MPFYLEPPPMGPLSRLLAGLVAILALVGAFFFGLFVLAVVVGLGVLAWLALALRTWWLRRGLSGTGGDGPLRPGPGRVIEGDYDVLARREDRPEDD
jgi:hypothetical protein